MMSSLKAESWTWYSLCVCLVILRLGSRALLRTSWKKLQVDDWIMCVALCSYTVLVAMVNVIIHTNTNLMHPEEKESLTPQDIKSREFGSKLVLIAEEMQINTIWMVKACLLIMYSRLTRRSRFTTFVKILGIYVAIGFIIMQVLYLGVWCRPFYHYWQVPTEDVQCNAQTNHLITNVILNVSSDIMILILPMPVVLDTMLPLKKKAILCGIFLLGSFTIISALLNKYYSFHDPFSIMWTFWYIRESSTAILVANIPFTWTLFQRVFNLHSWAERTNSNGHANTEDCVRLPSGIETVAMSVPKKRTSSSSSTEESKPICNKWSQINHPDFEISSTSSQEYINRPARPTSSTTQEITPVSTPVIAPPLEIWRNVDYSVTTNSLGHNQAHEQDEKASCNVQALEKGYAMPRRQSKRFIGNH